MASDAIQPPAGCWHWYSPCKPQDCPSATPPACKTATNCPPTDHGQCRIIINDLQREIDRLQGRWDSYGDSESSVVTTCPPDAAASEHHARPIYAVDPLGTWTPLHRIKTEENTIQVVHMLHVTNFGTLIDALA